MIPTLVYFLCALTSLTCTGLLLRAYRRRRGTLLLWSSVAFVGLALNNILLFVDPLLGPSIDLAIPRAVAAFAAVAVLLYGLVTDSEV